jgi:hypothetical protein
MGQFFLKAKKYIDQLDSPSVGQFIEIGTSRNLTDGSTKVIASWAEQFAKTLYTVDVDFENCKFAIDLNIVNVKVWHGSGEKFFETYPEHLGPISFLYLDNFDWDWHPEQTEAFVIEQQRRYDELGLTMNNVNSQRAHLEQMMSAMPNMAEQSIVVLDDTWYNKWWGHYSGKGGAVVPYLLNNGYTVLETEEQPVYGTIMGRGLNDI